MKRQLKRISGIILSMALLTALITSWACALEMEVRGQVFYLNGAATDAEAYEIGGVSYVKIRDAAALLNGTELQFSIDYSAEKQTVYISTGSAYTANGTELAGPAKGSPAGYARGYSIEVDGKTADAAVYSINNSNFIKVDDLMVLLGGKETPSGGAAPAAESSMTLEQLKESFALKIDTTGMSAGELYAKGQQYEQGEGVVQWYAMAAAYYEAAAAAGSAEAAESIARLEEYKKSVLDNSPDGQGEIFDFFRTGTTAGQAGDYETQYAVCYDDAFFFEDPVLRGIGGLGDLLRDGQGVERDLERALSIYKFNAGVLGKGGGYTSLGLLYQAETGTYPGITHSDDKAVEYFLLSFKAEGLTATDFKGPRYAGDLFDSGYYHDDGTFEEPDYVKAEECYIVASKGNGRTFDGTACYKLGVYYEEGREGIEQDYEKSAAYYQLAISDPNTHATMLGIPQTYLALGRYYENGTGVEKDLETAISYYTQALEAAQENLELVNAAGNEAAKSVYEAASAALARLA